MPAGNFRCPNCAAGLGFAVVADEVRSLAQRSSTAARETAKKIHASLEKSECGR